jgi:hypothetical protein
MIVLIDTNVVFDVLSKRQPHYSDSNHVLLLCRRKAITGAIAFHTIANVFHFYGKSAAPFLNERILAYFNVHGAENQTIREALDAGISDWEDALQTAAAVDAGASFIIRRNVKDFKLSRIPAISPKEFLRRFHPV